MFVPIPIIAIFMAILVVDYTLSWMRAIQSLNENRKFKYEFELDNLVLRVIKECVSPIEIRSIRVALACKPSEQEVSKSVFRLLKAKIIEPAGVGKFRRA
jgi:hypothetical protein